MVTAESKGDPVPSPSPIPSPWASHILTNSDGLIEHDQVHKHNSPREWMESIESLKGIHGAYTVLRCDIKTEVSDTDVVMDVEQELAHNVVEKVWGERFHLKRLKNSYEAMIGHEIEIDEESISLALNQSKMMIRYLQSEACNNLTTMKTRNDVEKVKVVMITLLWQSCTNDDRILVRSHAFSTNTPSTSMDYEPDPVTAAVALSQDDTSTSTSARNCNLSLPARHDGIPRAKVSSWCRLRRPLEEDFKTQDVSEVLLTKPFNSDWELLEGLTSNLFVVYKDGSIRTTNDSVLEGYARNLFIEAAKRHGLNIIHDPILLSDAKHGLWSEAFVTSSIRLAIPLSKMILGDEVWTEAPLEGLTWKTRRWKLLYDDIINNKEL